ncbi:hypothetical protein SCYAM73S_06718 [Streptomyces cyaneofuscatus]
MTAIAGRRMAETIARAAVSSSSPKDIPIEVVTDVITWVKTRHLVLDTPIELAPGQTVADALSLLPKRAHGAGVVVDEDRRPVGVVTDHDLTGVDRFTQLSEVMSKDLVVLDADIDPRDAFNKLDGANRKLARRGQGRPARRHPRPEGGPARHPLHPRHRRPGPAAHRGPPSASTAMWRARPSSSWTLASTRSSWTPRPRPPGVHDRRGEGRTGAGPAGPDRRGEHRRRRGRARPDRGGRRHHQGRRRPRRHVHHPDDDRRRPAAVLRRPGVRRRGEEARQARLGGRRRPPPRAMWPWRSPPARPT